VVNLDPGLVAVLVVAAFFGVWYYGALVYSRRLVRRIATELKGALRDLGGTSKIQWFGMTAFRMMTDGTNPPFREFSVTVTLRPREMPINWAIGTAQGRRDAALIEASLRKDPGIEFELVDPQTRVGRRRSQAKGGWSSLTLDGRQLLLSSDDERAARRTLERIEAATLEAIAGLHVSAGTQPGIAASVTLGVGAAAKGIGAVRALAAQLSD